MKWFKHQCNASSEGQFIAALEDEFGLEGYARYFKLIEIVGLKMEKGSDDHEATYPLEKWRWFLKAKQNKLSLFLEYLEKQHQITTVRSGNLLTIKIPKLLDWRDETTSRKTKKIGNKSEATPDLDIDIDIDIEEDTAKAASSPQTPQQKKPLPLPLFCEESQPIKTTGGQTEQGLDLVLIRKDGTRQTEIEWLMQNLIHHVRSGRNGKTQLHDGSLAGFCGVHPEANKLLYEWKKLSKPERMAALFTSCLCPTATNELRYALAAVRNKYGNYLGYWEAAKQAPDTDREVDLNETQRDTAVFDPKETRASHGSGHSEDPQRVENGQDHGGQPQQFGNSSGIQPAGAGVQLF